MSHKVLIVEDDEATRAGLQELLANAGYEVIAVGTVPAGMQVLRNEAPVLLIADVRVDGFNGLQLLLANTPRVQAELGQLAIFVTAFPDRVLEAEAREIGAEFLLKPILPSELLALVERKLAGAAAVKASQPERRWPRTRITREMAANVATAQARILDVSYGGLRIEMDATPGELLPRSFSVTVPASDVAVGVDLIWQSQSGDARWHCGLAVRAQDQTAWRQLVDEISYEATA